MSILSVFASALAPDLRDAIAAAQTVGSPGIQLAAGRGEGSLRDLSRSGQRDLLHLISSRQLTLTSLFTTAGQRGFSPGADIDQALDHLKRCLQAAADLQRGSLAQRTTPLVLCVDLGPLPPPPAAAPPPRKPIDPLLAGAILLPDAPPTPTPTTPTEPRDEAFEALLDGALRDLGHAADTFGVPVAFRSSLGSWRSLHRALSAAACPLFGLDLDPVALLQEPGEPDEVFAHFAHRIHHLRGRDALRGSAGRTQPTPLGKGSVDWPRLRALLEDAAFNGPLVIDPTELPDRATAARSGLAFLQSLVAPR